MIAKIVKIKYIQLYPHMIYLLRGLLMWNNYDWAKRHIQKHNVLPEEAWEVIFNDPTPIYLRSPDQLHFPPYIRYWAIGLADNGRELFVAW